MAKAEEFVPEEYWSSTPLLLRATAGLRLLSAIQAENLLNAVREVFVHSGFLIKDDAIGILDGVDEGIYSWFTINFLLGKYHFHVHRAFSKSILICRSFG